MIKQTYGYTDDYGRGTANKEKWFNTIEEADAFIKTFKKGNGGYAIVGKRFNYTEEAFKRMEAIKAEMSRLTKELRTIKENAEEV